MVALQGLKVLELGQLIAGPCCAFPGTASRGPMPASRASVCWVKPWAACAIAKSTAVRAS
jgi:hypothetical protein